MELNSIKFFYLAFGFLVSTTVFAQDLERTPTFFENLKKQERQEHEELVSQIKSMDEKGYRKMLTRRINDSYKQKEGNVSGFVIVDVTEEINKPEPSFLAKFFSSSLAEEEYGVNEIEETLRSSGMGNGRKLKYYKKLSNADKNKHFQ